MLNFCGQDRISIDANGRIKFSPRILRDFTDQCSGQIVMHCLPEGALAVYPEETFLQMRRGETRPAERAAASLVFRRSLRRFGALSQSDTISAQGRITIPVTYREHAGVASGDEVIVVGVEIGVEIWALERWAKELEQVSTHVREKGELEMVADLTAGEFQSTERTQSEDKIDL